MLTARRIREQEERERAGLPPPPPPLPNEIPMHQHQTIVRELNKQHAAELAAARSTVHLDASAVSKPLAKATKALETAGERIAELETQLAQAKARTGEIEAINLELTRQLEQATAPKASEARAPEEPTGNRPAKRR